MVLYTLFALRMAPKSNFPWRDGDSGNPKIAKVTAKGKVTGKKKGTVKITAKAKDGSGKKATITLKVK